MREVFCFAFFANFAEKSGYEADFSCCSARAIESILSG